MPASLCCRAWIPWFRSCSKSTISCVPDYQHRQPVTLRTNRATGSSTRMTQCHTTHPCPRTSCPPLLACRWQSTCSSTIWSNGYSSATERATGIGAHGNTCETVRLELSIRCLRMLKDGAWNGDMAGRSSRLWDYLTEALISYWMRRRSVTMNGCVGMFAGFATCARGTQAKGLR